MLKDRNKPTVPARGPRGRKRKPGEVEETASPELPASSLETCRGLLRSILTHWGPVFPGPVPDQDPEDLATPQSDEASPMYAVATLVVSWVLRSAAQHPLSRAEASGLLRWLQSHIVPQPAVVAELLRDSRVRSGLFQLYSRLCGQEGLGEPEPGVPALLNMVMLPLVVALCPAGTPLPAAVETLRLSSLDHEEEATRGA
ncbi:PREDICTED: nucleolar pre-ribosomal-associated protein 1-like [Miniopterus natalensis]|uniref:nucleolar pre-ribosomal-associated protein 1-like n=1 Tax=Miniopterus natalensis TaxID=291302 RepID=UPI0007A71167|nr:PREDICTED: nucleolar pre-ribosomal-associated protein 1-like [Miniopterus natalensis]